MKNQLLESDKLNQERTLLAAERTFSAWLRTGLAAMAGGLAILRLIVFKTDVHKFLAHLMGELLILWGCLVIILAMLDYKRIYTMLPLAQTFKSSKVGFITIVLPLLVISALLIFVTLPV